jgi:hypothetical protein
MNLGSMVKSELMYKLLEEHNDMLNTIYGYEVGEF